MDPFSGLKLSIEAICFACQELKVCVHEYRNYSQSVKDLELKLQASLMRLSQVQRSIAGARVRPLNPHEETTLAGLANKLKDLQEEVEKRCQTARGMGAMEWAFRRYSSKLLSLGDDLMRWITTIEDVLLQLNRDNSTVLQIDLGGVVKGAFASRLLLQRQATEQDVHFKQMPAKVHHFDFHETNRCGKHAIGTIDGYNGLYIAKTKPFASPSCGTDQAAGDNDFQQLARLLHNGPVYDDQLAVLSCQLFSEDHDRWVYTLFFALPRPAVPTPLSSLLDPSTQVPPLQVRLRIASRMFNSVGRLHAYAWLHKSLKPSNIYFVDSVTASGATLEPKLLGFDTARLTQQVSRRIESTDRQDRLYLHPDRWDTTTVSFSAVHDIYAVGVILAEIYLWQEAASWDGGKLLLTRDAQTACAIITDHVNKTIPQIATTKVTEVIVACLKGIWRSEPVARAWNDMSAILSELSDASQY